MNVFDILPENLFSILASKNKKIYMDAILVIKQAFEQEMSIPKQRLIVLLISNMEQEIMEANFEEETEEIIESTLSAKAHFLLRRLKWAGWIEFEIQESTFEEHIILPDYSIDLMNLFYSLTKEKEIEYNSYAYITYSSLKIALQEKNDRQLYTAVLGAYSSTKDLVKSLKSLHQNLGRYYKNITKMENINAMLAEHFDNYKRYIDKIYHPLKTTDPIDMYRIPIKRMVEKIIGDTEILDELVEEGMKTGKYKEKEEAQIDIVMKLGEISDIYENIGKTVGEVERKNSEYVKATIKKIGYLLSSDKELKGKLIQLLKCSKDASILEQMQQGVEVYKQSYVDKDSVFLRSSKSEKKQGKPTPIQGIKLEDEQDITMFMDKIQNSYTSKKIADHMRNLFGEMPVITNKDIILSSDEDFILLMLGTMNEVRSFYTIEYTGSYSIQNGYRIPEMKLIKKEK